MLISSGPNVRSWAVRNPADVVVNVKVCAPLGVMVPANVSVTVGVGVLGVVGVGLIS